MEDSALIRKVTRLTFPSRDHELHEAENGVEALTLLDVATTSYDATVLDLRMSVMNGVEFIHALRRRRTHAQTPIVVASSEGEISELLQDARQLGVAAILKKPWKPLELAQAVQRAAAESRSGA